MRFFRPFARAFARIDGDKRSMVGLFGFYGGLVGCLLTFDTIQARRIKEATEKYESHMTEQGFQKVQTATTEKTRTVQISTFASKDVTEQFPVFEWQKQNGVEVEKQPYDPNLSVSKSPGFTP